MESLTFEILAMAGTGSRADITDINEPFVKATPEICSHIVEMVNNTEDDDWTEYIQFENDELFFDYIRGMEGEIISLCLYGEPLSEEALLNQKRLTDGFRVFRGEKLLDEGLFFLMETFSGMFAHIDLDDISKVNNGIRLMKANGLSDSAIRSIARGIIKSHSK